MRVVGGRWKGRRLAAPAGRETRPTSDKVREAMFDVLFSLLAAGSDESSVPGPAGDLTGHRVLDLYAGSGALGIEALSRGAATCTFVDSSSAAVAALRGNLERLGVPAPRRGASERRNAGLRLAGAAGAGTSAAPPAAGAPAASGVRVVAADARRALAHDAGLGERYTLVFADPPYRQYAQIRPVLARLVGRVIAPRAVLVIETAATTPAGLPWTVVREKRYGDTRVTFLIAEIPAEGVAEDNGPSAG